MIKSICGGILSLLSLLLVLRDKRNNHLTTWGVRKRGQDVCVHSPIYSVVIDAGSTGSRVHVYEFQRCADQQVHLVDELFSEVKPGLSSYALDPAGAARSLLPLLAQAKVRVPRRQQPSTEISVRATAGLRLLPAEQVTEILTAIKCRLEREPFRLNEVRVIDGEEEGYLAWLTARFLLKESGLGAAVLDLGGASTQIVFATQPAPGGEWKVFRHSYLGYGLKEAKKRIINNQAPSSQVCQSEFGECGKLIEQIMFPPITGKNCSDCAGIGEVIQPRLEQNRPIIAFSYFYDRTIPLGLKNPITPLAIQRLGQRLCADRAKWCLDLAYLYTLLTVGYRLDENHPLTMIKQIDGWEAGWALGSALESF